MYQVLKKTYGSNDQFVYSVPHLCPYGPGPNYPPKYDTLSHGGVPPLMGHFTFGNAYPYTSCSKPCVLTSEQRNCDGNVTFCEQPRSS
jgi:hypothetical protein